MTTGLKPDRKIFFSRGILRHSIFRPAFTIRRAALCINRDGTPARRRRDAACYGGSMARITVEDCQERVDNRFLLVQMAIKRVRQYREGYEPLLESRNKEAVTALREIADGKVLPDDLSLYTPLPGQELPAAPEK